MPVRYALSGAILRLDLEGEYEPKDIVEQFQAGLADPGCPKKFSLLVDVTRSTVLERRAPEEVRGIAGFLGSYRDRVERCAVVAERDVHFGLSRLGSVYSQDAGVESQVFRDLESALRWLGAVGAEAAMKYGAEGGT